MVPFVLFIFLVPPILLALIIITCIGNVIRIRRASLIRHLSFVIRRNLPLVSSLYTTSVGEPPSLRFPLRQMSRLLELGIPLSDAIGMAWPRCPRVDRSILRAAEQSGSLPDAIAVMDARYQHEFESNVTDDRQVFVIPAITFLLLLLCIMFAVAIVFPKFVVIMYDFDIKVPEFVNEILLSGLFYGSPPTTWYGFLFHGVIVLVILVAIFRAVSFLLAGLLRRIELFSNIADSVRWSLPPLRRAENARAAVVTLPMIRVATAAGWPLDQAVDLASTIRTNVIWRQHLRDWAEFMRRGSETIAAGRAAGMPEMLLRYLAVGIRDTDLEAPLYAAEQYFSLLYDRQRRAMRLVMSILATIATGVLVGCVCVAIVVILVNVIDSSAAQWWDI